MTAKFFAILTNQGAALLANATALGTKLSITKMAVGDGNGTLPTPDATQTKLVNQKRIAPLNMLSVDASNSSQIIAEQVIPENEGGFWIREIGLYDDNGVLLAVANCPETYKPQLQEGSGRTQTIRMVLIVSSTAAVTLKIDPSVVLATRKYVDDRIIEVKAYSADLLKKHLEADNPHPQYALTRAVTDDLAKKLDKTGKGVVLPRGYNIPFHIRNNPGLLYAATSPGTYTNEPDFDGDYFDVFSIRHADDNGGVHSFLAVSKSGKVASAALNGESFSGWNMLMDYAGTTPTGRQLVAKQDVASMLAFLGLGSALSKGDYGVAGKGFALADGVNIPFHIRNTPGLIYCAVAPGTYTNEPDFGGEIFDVLGMRHSDTNGGEMTFIAVSRAGKMATASLSGSDFSGWNRSLDNTNTTPAGRELLSRNSAREMASYLGMSQAGQEFAAKNDAAAMAKYLGLDVIQGRLLNIVKITSSGTYTPSAGTKSIIVEAIGGGGASGNLTATAANQNAISAAGSNGGYAKARYTSGFSSVSVTIGAGGVVNGGSGGGYGGNGGATTFGSLLTCPGGNGSAVGVANVPPFNAGAAQSSGLPTGSGIIFSNRGPYSPWPTVVALGMGSNFANCIVPELGSYGMGGDGVVSDVSSAAKSGNAGTPGCVIVWEYA